MKNNIFLVAFLYCYFFVNAQPTDEVYKFSAPIYDMIQNDTVPWKYQVGATNLSFIGKHKDALAIWDKGFPGRKYIATSQDSLIARTYQRRNAKDYIIDRASSESIIIVNEAHHNPMHRTFTLSLLHGLYEKGYRYLGLEALSKNLKSSENFATNASGFYTNESEFGNLIYEAIKLGFTIFEYEATAGKNGKEREIEQARNIERFLKQNSSGKVLIHCGFDHVFENEVAGWEKAMAGRLKEFLNVDPLTIDQVRFTEKSSPSYSHFFTYTLKATNALILLDENDVAFNGFSAVKQTDISVIHPRTTYINGRPDWLVQNRTAYRIAKKKLSKYSFPVQVLAFREGEFEQGGIPSDIIEINKVDDDISLYLLKNRYKLIIRNSAYKIIDSFSININ